MRTRLAMLCSVVAVACVIGAVPMAEGDPVDDSFTFPIGTTTIHGLVLTNCIGPNCFVEYLQPFQFDFSISAHTELVGLTASFYSNDWMKLYIDGPAGGTITWDPFVGSSWDLGGSPCGEILCISFPLPAGPGSYHMENDPFSWGPHTPWFEGPFGGDFQLDFTVVPEPSATLFLLGAGLAGLSGFAWWRHRRS